jgi:hypothetical protein
MIEKEWASLAKHIKLTEGTMQYDEMRKAFYAGVMTMFTGMEALGEVPDLIAMLSLTKIRRELEVFQEVELKKITDTIRESN